MARDFQANRDQFLERPLPSNTEGERAILGAILLDNSLINQAIEQLTPDDFYSPFHRAVFNGMIALFERGAKIDPILIGEELKKEGKLESYGGVAAIANLTYGLPHFNNIHHYAKLVSEKALARNLIKACNTIVSEALAEEDDAEIVLDRAEQLIFALANKRTKQSFVAVRPVAEDVFVKVQEYAQRKDASALTGLTTGYRDLDSMTSGLQKNDLVIVAARPSMGKCVWAKELLTLSDGSVTTIEEIYKRKSAQLLTLQENFKFALTDACDFIDDGIKPVFRVTTKLGRQVTTTITHPFLTINGWQKLENLKVGSKIAVPRIINVFGNNEWRDCEVKILGYLLGDGCLVNSNPRFTVGKPQLREDFESSVTEFGGVETVADRDRNRTLDLRVRKSAQTKGKANPLTAWLRELNLQGCNSHQKFIPDEVFTLKREQLALFLSRLFSTGGWACVLTSGQPQLGFASVSERMIRQIQHLLLRFGVIAKLKKRSVKYKNERRDAWQLDITDALSIKTFIREIGIYGKEAALKQVLGALKSRNYQTNSDLIPIEIWEKIAAGKGAESWASLARRAAIQGASNVHVGQRAPSRDRLAKFATDLENDALKSLAESEIYWDEIVSIEYAGKQQVYDLTIPETHNFIANDICVHNTAFCLNIAQRAALQADAVVGFFSLEMSKEQLVMRMLCSEAMVDAHRFRNGFLSRQEWERLGEALGRLAETKIFIDDTPGISVLEMRAKARRLAAEQKRLDLIIVDYMQLMTGGNKRIESRQQEVSQISRELKGLAKELNVPLIALSQLSRAAENRSDHKPQLSDLRESGCLTGDSLITLAETGEVIPISHLIGKSGFKVWALNKQTWKLEKAVVSNAFSTGRKSVFRLLTRLGRIIRATANHKFLAFAGWKRLDELQTGEFIALPRRISNSTEQTMSFAELGLLGHLIGDGCTLPRHAIQYTTGLYKQNLSRSCALRVAQVVSSDYLSALAESDVYWDEIVSIEFDGEEEVYDLTVDKLHNFVANDIIVHNSIEQDADVVAFIFREEYYKPTDENFNQAEIIIAKQRNGPTGAVTLTFIKELTRFEDLYRGEGGYDG
ncbi:MAG TPA: replicative DNA helicase [Pyrinomonadaceae bacterium]